MEDFRKWHNYFFSSLDCLGTFFEEDDIPYNFYETDYDNIKRWEKDIYLLLELSRKLSVEKIGDRRDLTPEHKRIYECYKDKIFLPPIARPDTILVNNQPKIIEFNYDSSAIEGLYEMSYIQNKIYENGLNSHLSFYNSSIQISNFIKSIFDTNFNSYFSKRKMAIMIYSDMNRYDQDIAEITASWITQNTDIECYVRMHEMLWNQNGIVTDGKNDFYLLYMYSTLIDTPSKTKNLEKLLIDSVNSKTLIISDPKDVIVDCKGSIFLLNEYVNSLNSESLTSEKEIINNYIPWSVEICKNKKVLFKGQEYDLEELLTTKQECFILKKTYSFYAKNIILGSSISKDDWKKYITHINNSKNEVWVAQEFLQSDLYEFKYYNSLKSEFYNLKRHFVISPYFFGDKIANFLIRVEKNVNSPILGRHTDGNMGVAFVGWKSKTNRNGLFSN